MPARRIWPRRQPKQKVSPAPAAEPAATKPSSIRTRATIAWLAALGAAATVVGGHDTIVGTEVNVRVWGTCVLAAGVVLMAGAAGLRGGRPLGRALAMIAALLGIALGALTFMAQAVNDEPDHRLAYWAAVILLCALSARRVRALTPPTERAQSIWSQLPFLKSAVSVGVLISVGQFWYTSIYLPTTAPASLTLESTLKKVGETDTRLVVKGSVTIRNTSDTRVNVLASSLDLHGQTVMDSDLDHEQLRDAVKSADRLAAPPAEQFAAVESQTLLSHRRLTGDGFYFEPGEVMTVPITTWIPKDRYDRVSINALASIARGHVLAIETEQPVATPEEHGVVVLTRVPEAGLLRKLTRGDRFVRTEYSSNIGGLAALSYDEFKVAELVSQGRTDPQIAKTLKYDDTADVAYDLANGLTKLGVDTRDEVAGAFERAGRPFQVWLAPDKQADPPEDFDNRLRRFYGIADVETTDVMAVPRKR